MALNVYLTVFKKYTTKRLKGLEVTYICVCYGVPLIPTFVFFFLSDRDGVNIYGPATLWCWISEEWQVMRIVSFYGPVWCVLFSFFLLLARGQLLTSCRIVLVSTLIIYILAGRVIFNMRGSLRRFAGVGQTSPRTPTGPTRDTLGTMSPPTTPQQQQQQQNHHPVRPVNSYSCTVSSGHTGRTRNSGVEANTAAWAYCRCAMLFFLALVITWVRTPPFIPV